MSGENDDSTMAFDGGVRWGVVQRLDPEPMICPMDNEATARKFHQSWRTYAQTTAAPDEPDRWPLLISAHITWQVVPDTATGFLEEAHRQSALAASSSSAAEDQAWVDDISQFSDEDFDSDVLRGELDAHDPHHDSALLLHEAQRWFRTFTTAPGEHELSLEVIDQIKSSISPAQPETYARTLAAFVAERRTQIENALHDYGSGSPYEGQFNYALFTQPECLILWERIHNARLALTRTVRGTEIEPAVAALADAWGQSLPLG